MNYQYEVKPVTFYVDSKLYESYQLQAQQQGIKTEELIRDAIQDYADKHFPAKNAFSSADFSRTVSRKNCANDFLTEPFWKEVDYGVLEKF